MHNPHDYAPLIPKPASILASTGEFVVSPVTKIFFQDKDDEVEAMVNLLSTQLQQAGGFEIKVEGNEATQNTGIIQLQLDGDPSLGEDGYELTITSTSILIRSICPAGLFYGVQTLRQLIPVDSFGDLRLPAVSIRDAPRFERRDAGCGAPFLWRGGYKALH